jgi:hypothetical protein
MSIFAQERRLIGAAGGWQEKIRGTNVAVSGTPVRGDVEGNTGSAPAHNALAGAGALAAGTYYYFMNCGGAAAIDVTLRMASHTGASVPTITFYPVLSDGVSIKGTATSVSSLSDATQSTTSLTTLRGERGCVLKIVVAASTTATFDQAEYSAF